jgi:hypothetical protein
MHKADMFLITPLRDLVYAAHDGLERVVRRGPLPLLAAAPLCRGKKTETGHRELVGRYPNRLVDRL